MNRYDPFSGAHRLRDTPIFHRAGSTAVVFLEPRELKLAWSSEDSSSAAYTSTSTSAEEASG